MRFNIKPQQEIYLHRGEKFIIRCRFQQILPHSHFAVEQIEPLIDEQFLNENVLVTYSADNTKPHRRYSFEAKIKGLTTEGSIILQKLKNPKPHELRNKPRIDKNTLPHIRVKCQKKESQVIDISSNGAHIILYESDIELKIGTKVNLKLIFDSGDMEIEGKIIRKWDDEFQRVHLAIFFEENDRIGKFIY